MGSTNGENAELVESMCAYALATSSTPSDVLQHFHKIRLEKIASLLQRGGDELAKHGTTALNMCIQTCQDTQAIFPRRLAESLAKLKSHPLVQDSDVRALYELNLDIHDRWIGDEARNYTPWPRHDELQRQDAERILQQWARQAIATFLRGIKAALETETRLKEVASLRQELIETWILSGSRMAGVKSANVLDDLREILNNHLESIVQSRAQSLRNVVSQLSSMLESASLAQTSNLTLWGTYPKSADISNGAQAFKSTLINIHQGRDNSVVTIVSAFDAWMDSVLEVKSIVKSMKEARWDDTFADEIDDSDDDDLGDSKQTLLSDDDPRLLEEVTQNALVHTLQNLGKSFAQIVSKLTQDDDFPVEKGCFVLRVSRELGERISKLRLQDKATPLATPFTPDLLRPLHVALAARVVQPCADAYAEMLAKSLQIKSKSHILWEGSPALPSQPSPSAIRYLQSLNKAMAAHGNDLWAPLAVQQVKASACGSVVGTFRENLYAIEKKAVPARKEKAEGETGEDGAEGEKEGVEAEAEATAASAAFIEERDRKLKQAVFDMLYIRHFIGDAAAESGDAIEWIVKGVASVAHAELDESSMVRLRKNTADYAKKTYLLFALLA